MQGLIAVPVHTQGSATNTGSTGSAFLNIGVGARAMGMGGAFGTLADDPTALYWNPAGIAGLQEVRVSVEHTWWVADMRHDFLGVVVPLDDRFKLGLSVIYFSSGDIEITTIEQPKGTGQTYSTSDMSLGGTLSWALTNDLSVGATLKYIRNDLYNLAASGIAFDAGAQFNTRFHSLSVALAVANLGGQMQYTGASLDFQYPPPYPGAEPIRASFNNTPFSLPLTYRAGLLLEAFELFEQPLQGHKLFIAGDLVQPSDGPNKFNLGAEYSYDGRFFLRSGYIFNADELGFNAGGGVRVPFEGITLEAQYAFSSLKSFSAVHRLGVGAGF
jgi:hypothetical protein